MPNKRPPTISDIALTYATIAALVPIRLRNPSLGARPTSAANRKARAAIVPLFGNLGIAGIVEAHQALVAVFNHSATAPAEGTPEDDCLEWARLALYDFVFSAPASTPQDAEARALAIASCCEGGCPTEKRMIGVARAMAEDWARLNSGAPAPTTATFAGWCDHG